MLLHGDCMQFMLWDMSKRVHWLKDRLLQDGMQVTFSEVIGMEDLNDGKPRKVKNCKVRCIRSSFLSTCLGVARAV